MPPSDGDTIMLYWYRDLMISEKFNKNPERHIKKVEEYYHAEPKSRIFGSKKRVWERFVGKKIPWKEYFVIIRATNPDNLFEVMGTRQWIFRHYERMDLYVIGLYSSADEAVGAIEDILMKGYEEDPDYMPRRIYGVDDDYGSYDGGGR